MLLPDTEQGAAAIERARQVFRFCKAFAERSIPMRRTLAEHVWTLRLCELPEHPAVFVGEVQLASDAEPGEDADVTAALIRVRRPNTTPAPRPPRGSADFLKPGWDDPDGFIDVLPARNVQRGDDTIPERFADDPERLTALQEWSKRWHSWADAERPAREAMRTFDRFYELYGRIERESERVELMLGDGRLRWAREDGRVDHPVLLQRVDIEFDASVPEFRIVDADRAPELYGAVLQGGDSISAETLNRLRTELEGGGYHPLARAGTSAYLTGLAHHFPRGTFRDAPTDEPAAADPVIIRDPVLFLRSRASGYAAAFDRVLEDIEAHRRLPVSLTRLVGVEPPAPNEVVAHSVSPWSEPPDVLLSKPANIEQVHIARALERHGAVIVQGPPGTGKSHTIANLIGHLVADGKRVLVTSHTTKALRVLRGHVVDALKPLCVSVLENDLEGRKQMEQAVRDIVARLTESNEDALADEVEELTRTRARLNDQIDNLTVTLRGVREAEYTPIVIAGEPIGPADAARWVREHATASDWLPGPIEAGAPMPLPAAEVTELYATNGALTREEEAEIEAGLPAPAAIPEPAEFTERVEALSAAEPEPLASFWQRAAREHEIDGLERLLGVIRSTTAELDAIEAWQRTIIEAGHAGGVEREPWIELERMVDRACDRLEQAKRLWLEHEPSIAPDLPRDRIRRVVNAILVHLEAGGSLSRWTLLRRREWNPVLAAVRVDGNEPNTLGEFRSIREFLAVEDERRKLAVWWSRIAEPAGLPAFADAGATPEPILREYAAQFDPLLEWWATRWPEIEGAAVDSGFRWPQFRAREVARAGPTPPFERDVAILRDALHEAVSLRLGLAHRARAERRLAELDQLLAANPGHRCTALRAAARAGDAGAYETALAALRRTAEKQSIWRRRLELLGRLATAAPAWADAIRRRESLHGEPALDEEDVAQAWRWRQLRQEIDRRAALDERDLTRRLHTLRSELRRVTAELIDRRAWLGQLGRTDLNARLALQGWADTQRRIGKGTGKRVPELQARARELLASARDAVPVWIMPLARVAESFDPARGRFDVVIVDEASQSDVMGLLAWYLGDRVAIVGDHEQVSPLAVGEEIETLTALIAEHLAGVPNSHLYDGKASIYDFARMCFGGTIALREHFRCMPDIIEFSNHLCYDGDVRPLRDPGSVARPHVIEYVVDPSLVPTRSGMTNLAEARTIAALMQAATELPDTTTRTLGAITLLGDEQAGLIQDLALSMIGAVELERRHFVAGNPAHFQGDERDIIFLSMVDVPTGAPLPLRQTDAFKQRYNVAASRAKDQLWLVHSLDPGRDLKPGDLRRALIEHVRDPRSRRREREHAAAGAASEFERAVIERLVSAGHRVRSQVSIGRYPIDIVVSDGNEHVAIECDGDRYHGSEQIPQDMARQAVLERVGWRFIRIRATHFYSDADGTMARAFDELHRLGVGPTGDTVPESRTTDLRERMVRRAWEIMRGRGWLPATTDEPHQERRAP